MVRVVVRQYDLRHVRGLVPQRANRLENRRLGAYDAGVYQSQPPMVPPDIDLAHRERQQEDVRNNLYGVQALAP
jgi:hypothetical protein